MKSEILMSMSLPAGLDPDLLRTFTFIAEEGSFTRAAERVGRTQSAVSMQMQRLETQLGRRVLQRGKGGAVQLTPHGQYLLERSRELLALNDQIWTAFRAPQMHGTVRLGTPDDYALRYLPPVLKRFADTHPGIEVDVLCLPSSELVERMKAGELDLTLVSEGHEPPRWPTVELWRGPLLWITAERHTPHRQDPLPLALTHQSCAWRTAAIRALERAGRRWRMAYTSASQLGTHAPVLAGLAVTVSTISWVPDGLRPMRADENMPELPDFGILMLKGREARQPVTDVLAAHIAETFRQEMRRQDRAG
jgi:DNA-binding transcriptional LysR family regulator